MSRRLAELYPTAWVTGASSGLGLAFAEMLLAEGVRVWGTSRKLDRLGAARSGLTRVALDLSDPAAAEAAFRAAAAVAGGSFDLVINNAGYGVLGEFGSIDSSVWERQIEAMVIGTWRLTHAAWRQMRARDRGCLVNISSMAAEFPLPFMSGYNAAKAALTALSESLIIESRGSGVRVIDFRPGDYHTDFNHVMHTLSAAPDPAPRLAAVRDRLDRLMAEAPLPAAAAADLRRALQRGRSGHVRSGMFFQTRMGPFLTRFLPGSLRRAILAGYFGLR